MLGERPIRHLHQHDDLREPRRHVRCWLLLGTVSSACLLHMCSCVMRGLLLLLQHKHPVLRVRKLDCQCDVSCTVACSIACWFVPATCTANGVAGTCIDTATCSNQGGTSTAGRELSPACALNSVFARLLRSLSWSCQHRGISVLQFTFSLDLFGVRSAAPRLLGANDSSLQPLPSLVFQHRQRQQGHLRVYQRLRCSRRCLDCWSLPWPFFHW